jgi:hypothetical protein
LAVAATTPKAVKITRMFVYSRIFVVSERPAPWLQEIEEGRFVAIVVNRRAVCQSLLDMLVRETHTNRGRDVEEDISIRVP